MNTKPIIGVTPLYDKSKASYWMLPGYFQCIEKAGGIPIMLPLTTDLNTIEQLADAFSGFVFTGGDDVSPSLYREEKRSVCGAPNLARDQFEHDLFHAVMCRDKPVLGICRGIQMINVLLGGTLYQDLPTEFVSTICHQQKPPYDQAAHIVNIQNDSPLFELLKKTEINVNSYHHQAISTISPELKPMAFAPDGLIEAIYRPESRFVWALQWHPEFNYVVENSSLMIMSHFIKQCVT